MTDWIKTGDSKKVKLLFGGKVAIVAPNDTSNIVPLFCSCCKFPMKDSDDSISYRKHGVCSKCDNRWTGKPGVTWPDGPDLSSDEWQKYIETRVLLEKPVINFR